MSYMVFRFRSSQPYYHLQGFILNGHRVVLSIEANGSQVSIVPNPHVWGLGHGLNTQILVEHPTGYRNKVPTKCRDKTILLLSQHPYLHILGPTLSQVLGWGGWQHIPFHKQIVISPSHMI